MHSRVSRVFAAAVWAVTCCSAGAVSAHAQSVEVDTRFGMGGGWASAETLNNNIGVVADVLLAISTTSWNSGVLAASLGGQTGGPYDTICRLAKDGGSMPEFPSIGYLSVLAGIDEGGAGRYTAGLAFSPQAGIGIQTRYDRRWGRGIGALFGVNGMAFHSFYGEPIVLVSIGVGILIR